MLRRSLGTLVTFSWRPTLGASKGYVGTGRRAGPERVPHPLCDVDSRCLRVRSRVGSWGAPSRDYESKWPRESIRRPTRPKQAFCGRVRKSSTLSFRFGSMIHLCVFNLPFPRALLACTAPSSTDVHTCTFYRVALRPHSPLSTRVCSLPRAISTMPPPSSGIAPAVSTPLPPLSPLPSCP